jgi:hypothetical protein
MGWKAWGVGDVCTPPTEADTVQMRSGNNSLYSLLLQHRFSSVRVHTFADPAESPDTPVSSGARVPCRICTGHNIPTNDLKLIASFLSFFLASKQISKHLQKA